MYCEGEEGTGHEDGFMNSLQSAEDDDSSSWPHSYPAYFPRFNLANKPKSRLGRRHVPGKVTSVKIDEEGQTSDEICNEQKSGSTPFPQRSSGMAWLRETPIKSVYPTTPGLTTRDSVENAKLGYKPSFSFQRAEKSNTDVDPLSFHSNLFSNTTEKSVHSLFNPTLGLKNIIFKNTTFKGAENGSNAPENIDHQGINGVQIKRDGNLRIKLFENSNEDKENISDNLKPMDRKLMEINSNTEGLFSEVKSLSSDIFSLKGSAENKTFVNNVIESNTDTPLDLSSGYSHSGNSSNSAEIICEVLHKNKATDNNNEVLKTDRIISNLSNGVESKLHHISQPPVVFRKPFDSVVNKNYMLTPGCDMSTSHNQQDHDRKHLPPTDIQGLIKEPHTTDNSRKISCVMEMKDRGKNSEEFTNSSDDSSKTSGPTTIKVNDTTIPVVLAQGQSIDINSCVPILNQQQNTSQNHTGNQMPTIFSQNSATNQNISAPQMTSYNASSKPNPLWIQKRPLVFNTNSQFKTRNSYADALKQVASKFVPPSQKELDGVSMKCDSVLPKQHFSVHFPTVREGEHQSQIDHLNMKQVQPLETVKTSDDNLLNMNLNTFRSFTHSQKSGSSTGKHDPLLKSEVPAASQPANIKNQVNLSNQHPNYVLVGECKPQYLSKQERVMHYRSVRSPAIVHSQQVQPETRQSPADNQSQQLLPDLQSVSFHEAPTLPVCEQGNAIRQSEYNPLQQWKQASSPIAEQEIGQGSNDSPSQQSNIIESQTPSPEDSEFPNDNVQSSGDNMIFAKPAVPPPQKSRNVLPTVKPRQPLRKMQAPNTTTDVQDNFKYVIPKNVQPPQNKMLTVNGKAYTVLSMLGRGGSSEVYQVLDPKTSVLMAVKCVDLSMVDPVIAEGYLNEIELLSKLQGCESVIRMFDNEHIKETKMLYVVMEKGDTDLSKLIRDISKTKKIPMSMVIHYWTEMLTAVKDIHDRGIIHSDLKPANFLLVSGRLKLIDFGIASSLQGDMTSVNKEMTTGTWNYMSPEAFHNTSGSGRGVKITYKSDVWSLGCILYNLIYGKTPFSHITRTWDKLLAIVDTNHKIDFPDVGVPVVLDRALKLCFHRDPKQRPSVAQLLDLPYHTNIDPEYLSKQLQSILPPEYWNAVSHLFNGQKTKEEPNTENKETIN